MSNLDAVNVVNNVDNVSTSQVLPEGNKLDSMTNKPIDAVNVVDDVDVIDNGSTSQDSPVKILDGVNALCNTTLYVLTKGFYPGADAHLVHQAKEFIKEIKKDVESKRKQVSNGESVDLGSK